MPFFSLVLYGIGGVVGAGIFFSSGSILADPNTGSGIIFSFLIAGLVCAITGVCYADYAARMPTAGGSYAYVYSSLGELAAWIAAIGNTFEYAFAAAAVARGFGDYAKMLLEAIMDPSLPLPNIKKDGQEEVFKAVLFELDWIAPILCILMTLVCLTGLKTSTKFASALTALNVGTILLIIVYGFFTSFEVKNLHAGFQQMEFTSVMKGASSAVFCFIAWDAVCALSEDVERPQKTIPKAIFATLTVVGGLFMLMVTVLCGLVDIPATINSDKNLALEKAPFLTAFEYSRPVQFVILSVVLLCCINVVYACTQGQPRIWMGIARDGLLPRKFAAIDADSTPKFAIIVTGILTTITSTFVSFTVIGDATALAVLLVQGMVCIGCAVDRSKKINGQSFKDLVVTAALWGLVIFTMLGGALFTTGKTETKEMLVNAGITALIVAALCGIVAVARSTVENVIPVVAAFVNFVLIGYAGFKEMGILAAIIAPFLVIYFAYGLRNSNLRQ